MNMPPLLIDEHGPLRLERAGRWLSLFYGDELLLRLPAFSRRAVSDAWQVARRLHRSMRPFAPHLREKRNSMNGHQAGFYAPRFDTIFLFPGCGLLRLSKEELAEVLIHELMHACGHACRLARPRYPKSNHPSNRRPPALTAKEFADLRGDDPLPEDDKATPEYMREEVVAHIGCALVCVACRLPRFEREQVWFDYARRLPLEELKGAIADAQNSARFILSTAE